MTLPLLGPTTELYSSPCMPSSSRASLAFQLAPRLRGLDRPTVWHEFTPLSIQYKTVNLGQGFPDWDPPSFVIDSMRQAIDPAFGRSANQYARSYAHMPLATVLAEEYSKRLGCDIDPATQIATAVGCTNVSYCALHGILDDQDEVIMFEPAFDVYIAQTKMAAGKPIFVPFRPVTASTDQIQTSNHAFRLDLDEFEAAITPKTKVILLNSPHNPTGKILTREELEAISAIIQRHPQIIVLADEVYEHIVFDSVHCPHISIASLPGMFERTLTLSSSGKTFSCTGWKVGWAVGPPHLIRAVTSVQQWVNFSAPTPNQDAIAQSLIQAREPFEGYTSYYHWLVEEYRRKRSLLIEALQEAGMKPIIPDGGFFIMADSSAVEFPKEYLEEVTEAMPCTPMPRDWALCRYLSKEVGVTAIPPSAFYRLETIHLAKDMVRFAFCKSDTTLLEAKSRFKKYFNKH